MLENHHENGERTTSGVKMSDDENDLILAIIIIDR